jgi:glutathione S-transferase
MVTDEIRDFRGAYSSVVYGKRCSPEAVAAFVAPFAEGRHANGAYLPHLEAFMVAHGGPYVIGKSLTFADHLLFDLLNTVLRLVPNLLTEYNTPVIAAWYKAFEQRPSLKAYLDSNPLHRQRSTANGLA